MTYLEVENNRIRSEKKERTEHLHHEFDIKRELRTAQLKKKIDKMLPLQIVEESIEEQKEVNDNMMIITNNTPFREQSSTFRKTGLTLNNSIERQKEVSSL